MGGERRRLGEGRYSKAGQILRPPFVYNRSLPDSMRPIKMFAATYARYLVGYSVAKHSIIISFVVLLSTFPFMYLYKYLFDFTSLSKVESRYWSIAGPCAIWLALLLFVGLSLRLVPPKTDEEYYVKVIQYGFSSVALVVFILCLDVSHDKHIAAMVLILELPALIFVVSHAALGFISGRRLSWASRISLVISVVLVFLGMLKVF
jgi:hypothetical protein